MLSSTILIAATLNAICLVMGMTSFGSNAFSTQAGSVAQDDRSDADFLADQPLESNGQTTNDTAIEEDLSRVLDTSEWFTNLSVRSDRGVVVLDGTTQELQHSEWAEAIAQRTEGVAAVINRIEVADRIDLSTSGGVVQDSLREIWNETLNRLPLLMLGFGVIVLTAITARVLTVVERRLLENRGFRSSFKDLVYLMTSIAVWLVGLMAAVIIAFPGMTPAKAITTLGLGTIAIGFAFKNIVENFFAGVLILWRYPLDRGDFITVEDITGKVEEITIRNTLIRGLDGELTVVPNAHLFNNNVDVLTNQPQRRVRIICGVAYGEDVDAARTVICEAVQACPSIQGIRTVEVFAREFADSSINFEVAWWTGSKPIDVRQSRDEVVAAIKRALDDAGIEIPFPYRTLTFKPIPEITFRRQGEGDGASSNQVER